MAEAGHTVWASDISGEHLKAARVNFPQLMLFQAIMEQMPCRSGSFDAVIALEVIEHTRRDTDAMDEVARLMRPGGQLVLTTPNKGLLEFLDTSNVKTSFRRSWPRLASALERLGRCEDTQFTKNLGRHRHYSVADIERMMRGRFRITRVARTGLGLFSLASAGLSVVSRILNSAWPRVAFQCLMDIDGAIDYGEMGYNLLILAERK